MVTSCLAPGDYDSRDTDYDNIAKRITRGYRNIQVTKTDQTRLPNESPEAASYVEPVRFCIEVARIIECEKDQQKKQMT